MPDYLLYNTILTALNGAKLLARFIIFSVNIKISNGIRIQTCMNHYRTVYLTNQTMNQHKNFLL